MPTAIDKLVENFPHPNITPIDGQPNYETLAELHVQLNSNAASVHSNLGNGQLGLLPLTVSDVVYNTLSNTPFVTPINPGPNPTIPAHSTGILINEINRQHDAATHLFNQYGSIDKALKQQIVAAIDPMFLRTLRSKYVGYQQHSTRNILDHLYATYANISASDLLTNDAKMKTDINVNQPIELFFDQIEDAVDFAAAGKCPYTPEQVTAVAYQLVFKTAMFPDECKLWKRQNAVDKTWTNFKTVFATAHQELRECQQTTTSAGFHSANSAMALQTETVDAIANLATATAADRASIATLTTTISNLTAELAETNTKLIKALGELAQRPPYNDSTGGRQGRDHQQRERKPGPHYCHTHGSQVWHPSPKCRWKGTNHQDAATEANKLNGSTKTFQA
jgi:hypothetical protein